MPEDLTSVVPAAAAAAAGLLLYAAGDVVVCAYRCRHCSPMPRATPLPFTARRLISCPAWNIWPLLPCRRGIRQLMHLPLSSRPRDAGHALCFRLPVLRSCCSCSGHCPAGWERVQHCRRPARGNTLIAGAQARRQQLPALPVAMVVCVVSLNNL